MFQRRLITRTIVFPLFGALVISAAFLTQVLQLERAEWLRLLIVWMLCYGAVSTFLFIRLRAAAQRVEAADQSESLSQALSRALEATSSGSNLAWIVGGMSFTLLGTIALGLSMGDLLVTAREFEAAVARFRL